VAAYSARARATLDALAKLTAAGSDVALEVPVGIDALGHAALVHLGSARRGGPFVIVDGTAAGAHDAGQFEPGAETPLERARAGTLVVLNVASLPMAAQDALAVALSERPGAGSGQGVPFGLVASLPRPAADLLEARHLSRALARFLTPNAVALPSLDERPEDLRGFVLDALCRSGVRFDGQTIGIEPRALSLLVDHPWPGNVRELNHVVERAAHAATGERVRVVDLEATGFSAASPALLNADSLPSRLPGSPPRASTSQVVARSRGEGSDGAPVEADGDGEPRPESRNIRRRRRR
jgi:DNA-binding NtrC family response regulator